MPDVKQDTNSQGQFRQGNRASLTHGVHAFLATGSLPKKASYIRRQLSQFKLALEAGVREKHSTISLYHAALIQSVIRHEARASLLQRWLRLGEGLSHADRVMTLKEIGNATDARDKALKALRLDDSDNGQSILATLYGPRAVRLTDLNDDPDDGGSDDR